MQWGWWCRPIILSLKVQDITSAESIKGNKTLQEVTIFCCSIVSPGITDNGNIMKYFMQRNNKKQKFAAVNYHFDKLFNVNVAAGIKYKYLSK